MEPVKKEGDHLISSLYQQAAIESPPPEIDTAILAAASRRLPKRHKQAWWSRWTVPAGITATLTIGISLGLMLHDEQGSTRRWQDASVATSRSVSGEGALGGANIASPPASVIREDIAVSRQTKASPRTLQNDADAGTGQRAAVVAEKAERAAEGLPLPQAPLVRGDASDAVATVELFPGKVARQASESKTRAKKAELPSGVADQQRSPESWIEQIRILRRDGKDEEAAREIKAFMNSYPGFALPGDLRDFESTLAPAR